MSRWFFVAALLFACSPWTSVAAQGFPRVLIKKHPVADNLYMLEGRGGNIGALFGDDGVFLIDDQFAPLTDDIVKAVRELSPEPIRFVVNTHWHGDHTGGNENLGKAGAVIVAHENVRVRMSTKQFSEAFGRETPPSPVGALPKITFTESMTFHWNGEEVEVFHVDPAHTDGDSIIHFKGANAIHMGDIYFNGLYPYIDFSAGGSIFGMIEAVDLVLARTNKDTKIIPGHGPLSNVAELKSYRAMLIEMRDAIVKLLDAGKSVEEVVAAKPSAKYDEKLGKGFLNPDSFVGIVARGIVRYRERSKK